MFADCNKTIIAKIDHIVKVVENPGGCKIEVNYLVIFIFLYKPPKQPILVEFIKKESTVPDFINDRKVRYYNKYISVPEGF
jgi:hypothetical protein